jgi:ubiquinone/menaquinone biosynthesis C-methylase UbiE
MMRIKIKNMEPQLEKIREVQKEAWNKSSAGWKKWDDTVMEFMRPMSDEMIRMLNPKDDDIMLDVATGTGEPGLTIASILKNGKVTGIDLSEKMLAVAEENAQKRGIKNFETICCDVSALPFVNDTFTAITCRFGFNLFPDMNLALSEMFRVLKPGGRIVTSVWNVPEKNPWVSTSMQTMIIMLQLTPPAPGAPGIYRCSQPGLMAELFANAGLKDIQQKEVKSKLQFENSTTYWSFITETSSPVAFFKADETLQQQIKQTVLDKVSQENYNGKIALESNAIVIFGEK